MVAAFYLVALAMVLGGAASIYQGTLIFAFSSGATLVTAGVIAATGGVLLAGLAALLGAVRRIGDALETVGEPRFPEPDEVPPAPVERRPDPPLAPEPPPGAREELRGTLPAAEPSIAGTYASGGNSYVMYSDGSVQADTPDGRFHFGNVDELKAFIARGGERR